VGGTRYWGFLKNQAQGLLFDRVQKNLELLRRDSDQRQDRSIPTDSDRQRATEEPLE